MPGRFPGMNAPLTTPEDYRRTLAEIRRLRNVSRTAAEDLRLARCEAAAADYAERLRASDLRAGRPRPAPAPGAPQRLTDAPAEEPSAEDPPPSPRVPD